jgi:hypothetical protein
MLYYAAMQLEELESYHNLNHHMIIDVDQEVPHG